MPSEPPHDAEYWRKRAEEARTLAERMTSAEIKAAMLDVAESYDRVARLTEVLRDWLEGRKRSVPKAGGVGSVVVGGNSAGGGVG